MKQRRNRRPSRDKALLAIAIFKWLKGFILILVGVGFLKLLHHDVEAYVENFLNQVRLDPDNRYLGVLLTKLNLLDDKKIKALGALTFGYSALFLVEGTGLFLEKRWAKYLTIVITVSFIPVEVYELIKNPSLLKCAALAINVAIAGFLVVNLRRSKAP